MKKILQLLKSYLFYEQILVAVTILSAFIPALNPWTTYENSKHRMMLSIFTDLGSIESYFESVLSSFTVFSRVLFVLMLLFYLGLVCYVCGLILTFSKALGGKRAMFTGAVVFMMIYFSLFVIYLSINGELLSNGSGLVRSLNEAWAKIPFGVYYHFFLALAVFILAILGSDIDLKAIWYGMRLNWIHRFEGGVHPTPHKNTRSKPIETIPPQKEMVFPLLQHIGAVCEPCVKVGDYVRVGQKIADSSAAVSAPIHSSVSGKVVKICDWDHPTGNRIQAIVVENDFEDNPSECFQNACADYQSKTPQELIDHIRESGIVGLGGATFPTHIKLTSGLGKVDTVIVNAAECEPYLSSDHRAIIENTDDLIGGMRIVQHIMKAKNIAVGIENNKPDAIYLLERRAAKEKFFKVVILKTKYPQGGEKQLIRAVTGRRVPPGKLPADKGCLVLNVDTVIAIYNAVVKGTPLMRRIVTVAGHGVERTGNVHVRIGTPVRAVLDYFGYLPSTRKLIMGGPMMGIAQYSLDIPVIKGTSGLLCFTKEQLTMDRDVTCIRCGSCVRACPMHLVPSYIAQYVKNGNFEKVRDLHGSECIECGCCSFTCPAKIPLIQFMRLGKQKVNEMNRRSKEGKK